MTSLSRSILRVTPTHKMDRQSSSERVAHRSAREGRTAGSWERTFPSAAVGLACAPMRSFLHVARAEEWEAARRTGAYAVPDGGAFTHGCYAEQLDGVLDRFYAGVPREELVLLEVEPAGLPVKVEPADDDEFPHVYGPIPVASVVATLPVPS